MRITDITIKTLQPPERGEKIHYDDSLPGFGVRVSEGGTKSFILTYGKLRRRETIGRVGILTLKTARQAAKERLAAYTLGKTAQASPTWATALDAFLAECGRRLRARTVKDYDRLLKRHFRFGEMKLDEISPAELDRRIDKLSDTPVEQHHAFVVLRTFFKWAHRKHFVEVNPMDRMQSQFRYQPRERVLSPEELRKVWNACDEDTFGRIVRLLILTGQRVGEVKQLSRPMIGSATITLPSWLTKNGREHCFPVGPMAAPLVKHPPFETIPNFAREKDKLDDRAGVTGWTLHDLRRTLRTRWAELGILREVAEKYINHVSGAQAGVNGIYDRYSYVPEMRAAVAKWEKHLQAILDT